MLREFEEPNVSGGFVCPICGSSEIKPIVLVGIPGTEDGNNMKAQQIHSFCYENAVRILGGYIEIQRYDQ